MLKNLLCLACLGLFLWSCNSSANQKNQANLNELTWEQILEQAKGSTVLFMMWQGSPNINRYINDYLRTEVKSRYDINLKIVGGQGPEIVQLLLGEKQASSEKGQVDMAWINGETFFQLRQIDGLYGPFVDKLPNAKLIDFSDPYIGIDFQQEVNYMECPWNVTQFAMVYESSKLQKPPRNMQELEQYLIANPGTFTISNDFSGMTFLKSLLAEISGSAAGLEGPFDETKYRAYTGELWEFINTNKKYFWKEGKTFPKEATKMDYMFANGEILLTYGFSEGGIDEHVQQGLFTKTTKGYAWDAGTIRNSNYVGITYNSSNKAGAMVVANFMISPEAQLEKANPMEMSANTVLDMERLDKEWQLKFEQRAKRTYGPTMAELKPNALQEPDPQYMIRLFEDFRREVIEK